MVFAIKFVQISRNFRRTPISRFKALPSIARGRFSSTNTISTLHFSTLPPVHTSNKSELSPSEFCELSDLALVSLNNAFEDLPDNFNVGPDYDVNLSNGVLTVDFGSKHGTYVINKQTPNKQIWLSSPKSGPKRFDYSIFMRSWIYRHDQTDLFQLLSEEISGIVHSTVTFKNPFNY